jgi:hypothetical protein
MAIKEFWLVYEDAPFGLVERYETRAQAERNANDRAGLMPGKAFVTLRVEAAYMSAPARAVEVLRAVDRVASQPEVKPESDGDG